jgi:hypothetical protein
MPTTARARARTQSVRACHSSECDTGQKGRGSMVARLAATRGVCCGVATGHARFRRRTRRGTNVRGIVQWRTDKAIGGIGTRRGGSTGIAAPLIGARARLASVRTQRIDAHLIEGARWRWWNGNGIALEGYAATFINVGTADRGIALKPRFATTRSVHEVSVGSALDIR